MIWLKRIRKALLCMAAMSYILWGLSLLTVATLMAVGVIAFSGPPGWAMGFALACLWCVVAWSGCCLLEWAIKK